MINPISNSFLYSGMSGFGNSNAGGISSMNPSAFDYRAAQGRLQSAMKSDTYSKAISTQKKDTADFLDKYRTGMQDTKAAAQNVSDVIQQTVKEAEGGKTLSEESLKKATDSVQKLVDAYNNAQDLATKNVDRGPGVEARQKQLESALGSKNGLAAAGITMDKNGKLSLDAAQLKESLAGSESQRKMTADVLGGNYGIAQRVVKAADSALNQNPASLVSNDLQSIQKMQSAQQESFMAISGSNMSDSWSTYNSMGVYTMMNMGTIGMLMNMTT